MNIKKWIYGSLILFFIIVALAVGLSAKFDFSNFSSDPYKFIEDFFAQWSPALGAFGTMLAASLAATAVYHSFKTKQETYEDEIRALHDEIKSNYEQMRVLLKVATDVIDEMVKESKKERKDIVEIAFGSSTISRYVELFRMKAYLNIIESGHFTKLGISKHNVSFIYDKIDCTKRGVIKPDSEFLENLLDSMNSTIKSLESEYTFLEPVS